MPGEKPPYPNAKTYRIRLFLLNYLSICT